MGIKGLSSKTIWATTIWVYVKTGGAQEGGFPVGFLASPERGCPQRQTGIPGSIQVARHFEDVSEISSGGLSSVSSCVPNGP